ncbi:MAG: hypothetical protein ACRC0L_11805, partial [Angustibacter sp.]
PRSTGPRAPEPVVIEPVRPPVFEPVAEPVRPPVFEPVAEPVRPPVFEPVASGFDAPTVDPGAAEEKVDPQRPLVEPTQASAVGTRMQRHRTPAAGQVQPVALEPAGAPGPDAFAAFDSSDVQPSRLAPMPTPGLAASAPVPPVSVPAAPAVWAAGAAPADVDGPMVAELPAVGAGLDILPQRAGGRGLFRRRSGPSLPAATRPGPSGKQESIASVSGPQRGSLAEPMHRPGPLPAPSLPAPNMSGPAAEPQRGPLAFSVPQLPGSAPVLSEAPLAAQAVDHPGQLSRQSEIAANMLSELSSASYTPPTVQTAEVPTLTRRTPLATEAGKIAEPTEPVGNPRGTRNATDVRTMLSGFRAGVERGRTSPTGAADQD